MMKVVRRDTRRAKQQSRGVAPGGAFSKAFSITTLTAIWVVNKRVGVRPPNQWSEHEPHRGTKANKPRVRIVCAWSTNVLNPNQLEPEEMNRIMALCKIACAAEGGIGDMPGLIEEVSVDYLRTMNKIVLEAQTKEVKNKTLCVVGDCERKIIPEPRT